MKKVVAILTILTGMGLSVAAQELSLSFTSQSEARFFFYLNGKLQNQQPQATITFHNLENKDYHVRIVVDDPYEVALVKSFRPSESHNSYSLLFNPVKEKIIVHSDKDSESEYESQATTNNRYNVQTGIGTTKIADNGRKRLGKDKEEKITNTSTDGSVHTIRQAVFDEK